MKVRKRAKKKKENFCNINHSSSKKLEFIPQIYFEPILSNLLTRSPRSLPLSHFRSSLQPFSLNAFFFFSLFRRPIIIGGNFFFRFAVSTVTAAPITHRRRRRLILNLVTDHRTYDNRVMLTMFFLLHSVFFASFNFLFPILCTLFVFSIYCFDYASETTSVWNRKGHHE